jgi:uncharacterized protein (DUF362 family)
MIRLGLRDALKAAKTIVIKPNLVNGSWIRTDSHVVSDLTLLRDIVIAALEMNPLATVFIAESDSIGGYAFAYLKFAHLGLPGSLLLDGEQAKRVEVLDLSRDRLVRINEGNFKYFRTKDRQLWLSETLVKADFVVSLSNSKTHMRTGFTGACKNLFGCLPPLDKSFYHPHLHEVIHDITIAISPQLSIVDAFYAMEGNGPTEGRAIDCGYRVFSSDATEADLCAVESAGLIPTKIKYLNYLAQTTQACEHISKKYPTIVKMSKPTAIARAAQTIGFTFEFVGSAAVRYGKKVEGHRSLIAALPPAARPFAKAIRVVLLRVFRAGALEKTKRRG